MQTARFLDSCYSLREYFAAITRSLVEPDNFSYEGNRLMQTRFSLFLEERTQVFYLGSRFIED